MKNTFVKLLILAYITVLLITLVIFKIMFPGLSHIFYLLPWVVLGAVIIFLAVIGFSLFSMILSLYIPVFAVYTKELEKLKKITLKILNLFAFYWGKVFNIKREKIEAAFFEFNASLIKLQHIRVLPEEILLLLPRCIQNSECIHKVTINIENCHFCGKCQISEIVKFGKKYGIKMNIATGGTLARKLLHDFAPKAVVAVACERELLSGIYDSGIIPVFGIVNIRAYGPCFNTSVNIDELQSAIENFLGPNPNK